MSAKTPSPWLQGRKDPGHEVGRLTWVTVPRRLRRDQDLGEWIEKLEFGPKGPCCLSHGHFTF